jgi:hypothetical protein
MKSIVMFFFVVGIVMLALGYQKQLLTTSTTKTIIEYRFIPRSLYEEQLQPINLAKSFNDMFERQDVFFDGRR